MDKVSLKATIVATLNELKTWDGSAGKTQADAIDKLAGDLTDAVDTFVKTAVVSTTVAAGIVVAVDPVSHIGASTGTGVGSGSVS